MRNRDRNEIAAKPTPESKRSHVPGSGVSAGAKIPITPVEKSATR